MDTGDKQISISLASAVQTILIALIGAMLAWSASTIYSTSIELTKLQGKVERVDNETMRAHIRIDRLEVK